MTDHLARQLLDTPDAAAFHRAQIDTVYAHLADVASGATPMAAAIAEIAVALRYRPVRDILQATITGDAGTAAQSLWALLTRALSAGDRATATTLLAYTSYIPEGGGPLADATTVAALQANPSGQYARLLQACMENLVAPHLADETVTKTANRAKNTLELIENRTE
ncbi:DUF4192 family protein [Nocardia sp. NPDC052278]|uniref:DUF4192 family protein n=1 Tax=unclassified Nocardia TaxID=2637762 RepID=UPI0036C36681